MAQVRSWAGLDVHARSMLSSDVGWRVGRDPHRKLTA